MLIAMRIWIILACGAMWAENAGVFPPGVKPIGPYSPGVLTAEHLYVSGQGATGADGKVPPSFDGQVRQTLRNIQQVVETAKLSLDQIQYLEIYLSDLSQGQVLDQALRDFFPGGVPAHVVAQAARMPGGTPVEINAIAARSGGKALEDGVRLAQERLYVAAMYGRGAAARFERALKRSGSSREGLLMAAVYYVGARPGGWERARVPVALIPVAGLPGGAKIAVTGIAAKGKPDGETNEGCRRFRQTVYCGWTEAKLGTGIAAETATTLDGLLSERLRKNGMSLDDVVASHVFLGNIGEFSAMNGVYVDRFGKVKPSRTTLQPSAEASRFGIWVIAER
jgi:2-iminobutanoate/2-iminopropanoate deaminase